MTTTEAKQLLPQSVVIFCSAILGTVLKLSPTGFLVDWQNGQRGWIGYREAKQIELYQPRERK